MKIILSAIIVSVFLTSALMATTYNCTPSETGQGNQEDIQYVINTLLTDGDTVSLAEGIYYIENTLAADKMDISLKGVSGNPVDVVIDGNNLSTQDSLLTITTTGRWLVEGITFRNSKADSPYGEVSIIDGHLDMYNCIITGSSQGGNGVLVKSETFAASATLVNCEVYGLVHDGISSKGWGGVPSDRVVTAHFCYFHDINIGDYAQAMTPHDNATMKAYFCRFDNIGTLGTGSAIGSGEGDNPIEVYNCVFTNCNAGVFTTGALTVKNCVFDNIKKSAIAQGVNPRDILVEDCTLTNIGRYAVSVSGSGDIVIRRCRIDKRGVGSVFSAIRAANNTAAEASNVAGSITLEDCVIYSPSSSVQVLQCKYKNLFIRRNLVWTELDDMLKGVFHTFYSIDNEVRLEAEHNCIYKASGPIFSSWGGIDYGCDVAPGSYTGGFNTYQTGTSFGRDKSDTGNWSPLASDQQSQIEWRSFTKELMLPVDSPHYRTYGAHLMPAWLSLPISDGADTGFAQISTVSGISLCSGGYYLEMDFNFDCVIDFEDFAVLGLAWGSEQGDGNWNPVCDISDPNDDIIDNKDLDVFTDKWLTDQRQ